MSRNKRYSQTRSHKGEAGNYLPAAKRLFLFIDAEPQRLEMAGKPMLRSGLPGVASMFGHRDSSDNGIAENITRIVCSVPSRRMVTAWMLSGLSLRVTARSVASELTGCAPTRMM